MKVTHCFLGVFGSAVENLVGLTDYTFYTNRSIANKIKEKVSGCASHRFQVAVLELIGEEQDVVDELHSVLVINRNSTMRKSLNQNLHLEKNINNVTRWMITYDML